LTQPILGASSLKLSLKRFSQRFGQIFTLSQKYHRPQQALVTFLYSRNFRLFVRFVICQETSCASIQRLAFLLALCQSTYEIVSFRHWTSTTQIDRLAL